MQGNSDNTVYLKQQIDLYKKVLALAPGHFYWKDKNGSYRGCNLEFAKTLGLEKTDDVLGHSDYDFLSKQKADEITANDREAMLKEQGITGYEESGINPEGKLAIYLTDKVPLFDENGNVIGLVGISLDITERKKAEAATQEALLKIEAASRAKTEFIRNMQHDIRTPISHVIGLSEILSEDEASLAEETKKTVSYINVSAKRLMELVEEMLKYVNSENGTLPKRQTKFNLSELLQRIIELTNIAARQKGIEVLVNYDQAAPKVLIGDKARVFRILLNLIDNALKFTHQGYIKISVKVAEKLSPEDLKLAISIEDTGIGIPQNKIGEIFEKFTRLIPTNKNLYKGLGLGLSIVKQFIEELHGEVITESELEKGTKFTCILPFKVASQDQEEGLEDKPTLAEQTTSTPTTESITDKLNVLIVEDEEFAQYMQGKIVRDLGHTIDIAGTAQAALDFLERNHYDIILMDLGLPDTDGLTLTKKLRNELNIKAPIIAVTANADAEHNKICLAAGMDSVYTKPLSKASAREIFAAFAPKKIPRTVASEKIESISVAPEQLPIFLPLPKDVIDLSLGAEIIGGDVAQVKKILPVLLQSCLTELPNLHKAYQKQDWQTIERIAHKLKGGSSYCGTPRLHAACNNLQVYLKANLEQELQETLFQQVLQEIEALERSVANLDLA